MRGLVVIVACFVAVSVAGVARADEFDGVRKHMDAAEKIKQKTSAHYDGKNVLPGIGPTNFVDRGGLCQKVLEVLWRVRAA